MQGRKHRHRGNQAILCMSQGTSLFQSAWISSCWLELGLALQSLLKSNRTTKWLITSRESKLHRTHNRKHNIFAFLEKFTECLIEENDKLKMIPLKKREQPGKFPEQVYGQ
ncbi:Synembryn-A [Manis pentadactyla]|nr:Synembryn-A [Manis pentadactyla]